MADMVAEFNGARENQVSATFYKGPKAMPFLSEQEQRPIVHFVDYVKIQQVGDGAGIASNVIFEVDETHKRRWPRQWADYQNGRQQAVDGTPLGLLFPANPEVVDELSRYHIHTIEALAGAADSAGAVLPFLTIWKQKASDFLAKHAKMAGYEALEQQIEKERREKEILAQRLEALEARLNGDGPKGRSKKLFAENQETAG